MSHGAEDFILYLPFLLGQAIYVMKRAGFSMRAGRAKTRWDYVLRNWDIIAFRSAIELVCVYYPVRHYTPAQLLGLFGMDFHAEFLKTVVASPISVFAAGIGSDGILDWLVDWASRSPRVPDAVKHWLSENMQQPLMHNGGV